MKSLRTKFPYNQTGHPHWEAMKELFSLRIHDTYTGAAFYEENKLEMEATIMAGNDADYHWCLEYTEKAFVTAWNKMKSNYEFFQVISGGRN